MQTDKVALFQNVSLQDADTGGQTSTVGEPSVANNGKQVLITGNWYAARSLDGGRTWDNISPFNYFPAADGGFCCDQTVLYDPSRDLWFWLIQYSVKKNTNTLRVAVKHGPHLGNNVWHWWDFQPRRINSAWSGEWFDYNHAALSNNYLYVGSNVFKVRSNRWARSVVLKLALDELAVRRALSYRYFQSTKNGSLRCTLGARNTMYMASHNRNDQIRIYSWPEGSSSISSHDIDVQQWNEGTYLARGPDGNNWLKRCDSRITGSWVADGRIGLLWSVNRVGKSRPYPFIRVARVDESAMTLIDEPDIWNGNYAFAYPDACPNDRGHIGITLFRGGGNHHPGHVVGIWDDYSNCWQLQVTRPGTNGPKEGKWGDYLACRRHSPDGLTWIATGFSLQGGESRDSIEPQLVHFGRHRDQGAVSRWHSA